VEQNQAWIAPTIAADGHGRGSEMWRRLWGIMSDLGWDCQIFQALIKKTIAFKITLSRRHLSVESNFGEKVKNVTSGQLSGT